MLAGIGVPRLEVTLVVTSTWKTPLPPLVLLTRTHCNSCVLDIVGPRAESALDIWAVPGGVLGRFVAEVSVAPLSVPQSYPG